MKSNPIKRSQNGEEASNGGFHDPLEGTSDVYRQIITQAPVPLGLLEGKNLVIREANELMLGVWGKDRSIIGLPLREGLPETVERKSDLLIEQVFSTGVPYTGRARHIQSRVAGKVYDGYFDVTCTPILSPDKIVTHVLLMATDVTARYEAEQAIVAGAQKLKHLILSAPAAMGIFVGRDLIIELPNQEFIKVVGKGPNIEGRPLREVLPELESQPFFKILDDVYTSGKIFRANNSPVDINVDGRMVRHYYNIAFSPMFNDNGEVYAILDISIEVTGEVDARNKLEETENLLRSAIDLARLGVWTIDIAESRMTGNEQMIHWLGFDPSQETLVDVFKTLDHADRNRLAKVIQHSLDPTHSDIYDEEYTLNNRKTGLKKILKIRGKTIFDQAKNPIRIQGSARDVTRDRQMSLELEHQIQERTEALAASLEELRALNEDLALTNEHLTRSNEDLQRFAHVASHDLKEPIRKIKTFLSMIALAKNRPVTDETVLYMGRVNAAADRMFDMINGVLKFSSINSNQQAIEKVPLSTVMQSVVVDLELIIKRLDAKVIYEALPDIEGAYVLLHQLFYNLLANALKFVTEGRSPVIRITSEEFIQDSIPVVKIVLTDNGIGFENKFATSIFDSFIRLNAKDTYEGTGLGLSLCKRIVERHHGTISAIGQPNQGATFTLILPKAQNYPFI